ncbi:hypothetical protein [Streptomyces sp. H39-S7]|uniref:hypothetical protein n=1 Tax=Streptomyces sp. H39-S7 TaxID=3004357 RepID=UPI0022AFC201|nr:hypothetical protein [Streptomyces sp. H39-S7]MCZ4117883.1 hypothetical protein [Streptomyces sp. H39-S7]
MGLKNDLIHYLWTKDEVSAVKHKLNGISTTVDVLKFALAGISLGLTPVKIDFTGLKIDEKGVVLAGVQKFVWPYARDAKAKLEAASKKFDLSTKKAETAYKEAKKAKDKADRLVAARGSAGSPESPDSEARRKSALAEARKQRNKAREDLREAGNAYTKMKEIDASIKAAAGDITKAEEEAKKSYEELQGKVRNLGAAAHRLASSLA